jgi:hypothetical protein
VLSSDYLQVPDEEIASLESVCTILGGRVVYGAQEFADLAPPPPPVLPDWSPVKTFGGYQTNPQRRPSLTTLAASAHASKCRVHEFNHRACAHTGDTHIFDSRFWGVFGCSCWAV